MAEKVCSNELAWRGLCHIAPGNQVYPSTFASEMPLKVMIKDMEDLFTERISPCYPNYYFTLFLPAPICADDSLIR
jgi:hypothetical protein